MTGDSSAGMDEARQREEKLREQVARLSSELERARSDLDATRYELRKLSRAHEIVLDDAKRVQARLARVAEESNDSYCAREAELAAAEVRFRREHDEQRAEMVDERRVAEYRLESIIRDKLDIISSQLEELREVKHRLAETEARTPASGGGA